jgi:hypothetical protein
MAGAIPYVRNVTSLRELVERYYGSVIINPPVESDYAPTTTALAMGANKGQRTGYVISNAGANNAAIGFSPAVTITTGILMLPGDLLTVDWYFDQDLVFAVPWCVSVAGGTNLHMIEKVLTGG